MKRQDKIACYGLWKCRGGVTVHGFDKVRIERIQKPNGQVIIRKHEPEDRPIRIFHEETDDHPGDGYFEVDKTENNLNVLRNCIKRGKVALVDEDEQNEIMNGLKIEKLHTIYEDVTSESIMIEPKTPYNKRKNVSSAKSEASRNNIRKANAAKEKKKKEREALAELAKEAESVEAVQT